MIAGRHMYRDAEADVRAFFSGTCTVVIAMRSQFRKGELPNETPFRSARSDISSFQKLYHGVLQIDEACCAKESAPGWYETGKSLPFCLGIHLQCCLTTDSSGFAKGDLNSIGAFIFQSASMINRDLYAMREGLVGNLNLTSLYDFDFVDTA